MAVQSTTLRNQTLALHARIEKNVFYQNTFSKFMSYSESEMIGDQMVYNFKQNGAKIVGFGAINMHTDKFTKGGDHAIVPQVDVLDENFRYGDEQLSGFEVEEEINWRQLWLNGVRMGVKTKLGYSDFQANKVIAQQLFNQAKPRLGFKMKQWINYHGLYEAIFKGYSINVTADSTRGLNASVVSHPHFYYDNGGTLAKVSHAALPGTSGYEDAVEAACDGYSGAATEKLTHQYILDLRDACIDNKIDQIYTEDGEAFWVALIHPSIGNQLRNLSDFRTLQSRAMGMAAKNPIFNGSLMYYEGILFVEDPAIYSVDHTGGVLVYGPTNGKPTTTRDSRDFALGIIMGQNALSGAMPKGIGYTVEKSDHGAKVAFGVNMFCGFARNDFYEDKNTTTKGDLGNWSHNNSSIVFMMNKSVT